jgi:hypothetical protein
MEQTSILITGKFADEDMKALMAALRKIERRHPDDLYTAMIIDPKAGGDEWLEKMQVIFPAAEGVPPVFSRIKYDNGEANEKS